MRISSSEYSAQEQVFPVNSGTKAAILAKDRSSTANSGTQAAVLLGMDRCSSFPFLSAPTISSASQQTLKVWKDPRGTNIVENSEV